jgi:uncharacterized protein (UPF0128 family)
METKKAQMLIDKEEARTKLRAIFAEQEKPKVYTVLRHISSSGLSKDISLKTVQDGEIIDITYYVAKAIGDTLKERNGQRAIRVTGGGMDLGYHLVHSLSTVLYFGQDRAGYALSHDWA